MYVIRLPDGILRVPAGFIGPGREETSGGVVGQAYVEIGPDDPDYQRLLAQSVTEGEMDRKRRRWREGDDALGREFEAFKARRAEE